MEFHDEIANLFFAYPEAMGITGIDTPSALARFETMILDTIPNQRQDTWRHYGVSQEKADCINWIRSMRARMKEAIHKKSQDMVATSIGNKSSTITWSARDLFGHLIIANKQCKFSKKEVPDLIVDDIMTVYFVTDNLVEQFTALFMDLAENPTVYQKMAAEIR